MRASISRVESNSDAHRPPAIASDEETALVEYDPQKTAKRWSVF